MHTGFSTTQIVTNKSRGIFATPSLTSALQILDIIQHLQPNSVLFATELDLSWGFFADISADTFFDIFLSVVDVDNIPEGAAIRSDNAWSASQVWRETGSAGFTLPVQTMEHSDPRFFRPKSWENLEVGAATRRLALCILGVAAASNLCRNVGTVRYTEILNQRTWSNDNAYADIEGNNNDFVDDYGMQVF